MTGNSMESFSTPRGTAINRVADGIPGELTRGNEQLLLARLEPRVRHEDVQLDLNGVERIDAAGLSALITLYCEACNSGHQFTVVRPHRRVREILAMVGLDRLLLGEEEAASMERSAA